MAQNIYSAKTRVSKHDRALLKNNRPYCIWLTGLSASGKSTTANALEFELNKQGINTYLLDGDNIRSDLNKDLGFDDNDRDENIRRAAAVAKLFVDAGLIVICAFITPTNSIRKKLRANFSPNEFCEVFLDTPIAIAEQRDPKGLYRKARAGELKNFTGVDSPFEPSVDSELTLNTVKNTPEECAMQIAEFLLKNNIIPLQK